MLKKIMIFSMLLIITACGQSNNLPTSSSLTKQGNLDKAINLLKDKKYDEASVQVVKDVDDYVVLGRKDKPSPIVAQELNVYYYASAKEEELNSKPDMALYYLEKSAPIDGVVNKEELDNLKTELSNKIKEKKDEQEKYNSPEERKKRGVQIGMTKEEVLQSSWGKPEHINTTVTQNVTSEQWVYPNNQYLYFENGILNSIQQ